MKKNKTKIVITKLPRDTYFQWFIYGFYELERNGEIEFKLDIPFFLKLTKYFKNDYICEFLKRINKKIYGDSYNLEGYIETANSNKEYFCIDSDDSPYLYNENDLKKVKCYFKMQCPIDFNEKGFRISKDVFIPWSSHEHLKEPHKNVTDIGKRKEIKDFKMYVDKIKPLLIGTRRLSRSLNYKALKKGYDDLIEGRSILKSNKIMCYFGNAKGPVINQNTYLEDCDNEASILKKYNNKINHPNEKRKEIANIICKYEDKSDVRIINDGNSDVGMLSKISSLSIPLNKFSKHVGSFQYNANVSGYRLSIPNRFMDSFAVGTAIFTDKLFVKWYKPFNDFEVFESAEMGYLKKDDVDWYEIKKDIINLPQTFPKKIVEKFDKDWSPIAVDKYIIKTLLENNI